LSKLGVDMLKARGVAINNYASFKSNSTSSKTAYFNETSVVDFLQTLDEFEKKLLYVSQESYRLMRSYLQSND